MLTTRIDHLFCTQRYIERADTLGDDAELFGSHTVVIALTVGNDIIHAYRDTSLVGQCVVGIQYHFRTTVHQDDDGFLSGTVIDILLIAENNHISRQ